MKTIEWAIEEILTAHPDLYLEHCAVMAVALMRQQLESPCEFIVEGEGFIPPDLDGETKFLLRVSWTEHTALKALHVWHTEQSEE